MYPDPGPLASENSHRMIRFNLFRFLSGKKCSSICLEKATENPIQMVSAHNLLAYMMCIYLILSLQCIIGRFSTVAVFGCFVSGGDFVAVFWSIFIVKKAKQDQSGSFFLFNLLCE